MKMMAYGELRFDRASIPAELRDVANWPGADDGALSRDARNVLLRRIQAMALFVDGHTSLREIGRVTGVRFNDLYRLFDRCVTMHEDGRIFGVRALMPYTHTRAYRRSAPVTLSHSGVKGGTSGAFTQLLLRYPEMACWIERKVDERRRKNGGQREVVRGLRRLHRDFLDQCRRAGVEAHDYPFNQEHLGERSLATHVRHLANRHFDAAAQSAGATQIAHAWEGAGEHVRKPAIGPFDVIEFDGHKIDLRVTLRVDDPLGFETLLALHRIWILVLLDVATRAVIGYSLALTLRAREKRWTSAGPLKILESAFRGVSIRLGEKVDTTTVACPFSSTSLLYRSSGSSATASVDRIKSVTASAIKLSLHALVSQC